jgi:hypothetical protein
LADLLLRYFSQERHGAAVITQKLSPAYNEAPVRMPLVRPISTAKFMLVPRSLQRLKLDDRAEFLGLPPKPRIQRRNRLLGK